MGLIMDMGWDIQYIINVMYTDMMGQRIQGMACWGSSVERPRPPCDHVNCDGGDKMLTF